MRTSSYTIYADLPDRGDEILLVHGYTGSIERVTREVADYLRWCESSKPPRPLFGAWAPEPRPTAPPPAPNAETLERLRRRGFMTTKTSDEELAFFVRIASSMHEESKRRPTWLFMPSYDCNLRCGYCFQDHLRTNTAYSHVLRPMQPELIERIFVAIQELAARHGMAPSQACKTDLTLYGGEPLLRGNRATVEELISRTSRLGGSGLFAITNATELHHYQDMLGSGGITGVQITLDGPRAEHDRRRIRADGSGTFDAIADNIDLALSKGVSVSIRLNVDRDNIAELPELARQMTSRGWHENRLLLAYIAVIVVDRNHPRRDRTLDSWEATTALTRLTEEDSATRMILGPTGMRRRDVAAVLAGRRSIRSLLRSTYCGAHTADYMFDPLGDIYACWERTGDARLRIGHIDASGHVLLKEHGAASTRATEDNEAKRRRHLPIASEEPTDATTWRSRNVTTNDACKRCRYALFCGGGCAAYALDTKARYLTNYCDGFQNTFRADVAAAYQSWSERSDPAEESRAG